MTTEPLRHRRIRCNLPPLIGEEEALVLALAAVTPIGITLGLWLGHQLWSVIA